MEKVCWGIKVERIDLDHCRQRQGERPSTRDDVVDNGRWCQDRRRRVVPQRRGKPFVVRAEPRRGQRDRDEARLHHAEEPDDVLEALRSANRHAITRRSAGREFRGDQLRADEPETTSIFGNTRLGRPRRR